MTMESMYEMYEESNPKKNKKRLYIIIFVSILILFPEFLMQLSAYHSYMNNRRLTKQYKEVIAELTDLIESKGNIKLKRVNMRANYRSSVDFNIYLKNSDIDTLSLQNLTKLIEDYISSAEGIHSISLASKKFYKKSYAQSDETELFLFFPRRVSYYIWEANSTDNNYIASGNTEINQDENYIIDKENLLRKWHSYIK